VDADREGRCAERRRVATSGRFLDGALDRAPSSQTAGGVDDVEALGEPSSCARRLLGMLSSKALKNPLLKD
jgi:hypothetical protein